MTHYIWWYKEVFKILKELEYVSLFVIRDPRDIVISYAAYITRLRRRMHNRRFVDEYQNDANYLALVNGYPPGPSGSGHLPLRDGLEGFLPWMTAPGVMCFRFKGLVGKIDVPANFDNRTNLRPRRSTLAPLIAAQAVRIANKAWSPGAAAFRAGMTGEWRRRFDQSSIDAELLRAYGDAY